MKVHFHVCDLVSQTHKHVVIKNVITIKTM